MTEPVDTYIYLSDWSDEVMPCKPTLQGWADWLAAPDADWGRPEAAKDGDSFGAHTLLVLANAPYRVTDAGVELPELPAEATEAFVRFDGPESGWNVDDSTYRGANHPDTPEGFRHDVIGLIAGLHMPPYGEGDTGYVALVTSGPGLRIRFNLTADGPRCTIEGAVQ